MGNLSHLDRYNNRARLFFEEEEFDKALRDSDSCNTEESRAFSLEILYALGRIEETYKRIETTSKEIPIKQDEASKYEKIWIVACGTAYHAGLFGKDLFEKVLGVPVSVELASEFRYREPIVGKNDLGIVISQSGETMDTIAATELLKGNGAHVLALVNVVGSSLAVSYTHLTLPTKRIV